MLDLRPWSKSRPDRSTLPRRALASPVGRYLQPFATAPKGPSAGCGSGLRQIGHRQQRCNTTLADATGGDRHHGWGGSGRGSKGGRLRGWLTRPRARRAANMAGLKRSPAPGARTATRPSGVVASQGGRRGSSSRLARRRRPDRCPPRARKTSAPPRPPRTSAASRSPRHSERRDRAEPAGRRCASTEAADSASVTCGPPFSSGSRSASMPCSRSFCWCHHTALPNADAGQQQGPARAEKPRTADRTLTPALTRRIEASPARAPSRSRAPVEPQAQLVADPTR